MQVFINDSVVKVKKKYYPQKLLEECKYEIKRTKMENLIDEELEASSTDDITGNDFNEKTESDDERDNGEPNK